MNSKRQPTIFESLSTKRKILVVLSFFYIALCGVLGIYLQNTNIDAIARIFLSFILVFNMLLPFVMVDIWNDKDNK